MKANEIAGWLGMVTILGIFAMTSTGNLDPTSLPAQGFNLAGGALLAWNSFAKGAKPVGTLNATWAVIAAYGVVRALIG